MIETNKQQLKNLLQNIVTLRTKNKISKEDMANLLDISVKALEQIENGELPKGLSVDVVFNIQKNFGVCTKDQFGTNL